VTPLHCFHVVTPYLYQLEILLDTQGRQHKIEHGWGIGK
jgi:hypothetical protein